MTTSNEGIIDVTTSEAVKWRRGGVLSANTAETAGYSAAGGRVDGIFQRDALISEEVSLRLLNTPGTFIVEVNGVVAISDLLYTAASGVFSTTAVGPPVLRAVSSAAASGGFVEATVVRNQAGAADTVTPHIADYQLLTSDSNTVHTNTGAVGAVLIKLPTSAVGLKYTIIVGAAQSLTVQTKAASGDKVCLPDTGVPGAANKGLVNAGTLDVALVLQCGVAGIWSFVGGNAKVGIWTAEP